MSTSQPQSPLRLNCRDRSNYFFAIGLPARPRCVSPRVRPRDTESRSGSGHLHRDCDGQRERKRSSASVIRRGPQPSAVRLDD